ncbi:hypothetical protein [Cereibacter johrii]|uniref:Uncharacterized protein n=1 Tax=Cereibacter johrii TaxID=445629 RepID=A0ABX5J682_9RHOB|nr:hypothetical protein [Cereibacter johrii]PTM78382.1 hypothetical protein C8J29_104341 [Cereibacter johrii]
MVSGGGGEERLFSLQTEEAAWSFFEHLIEGEVSIDDINDVGFGDWAQVRVYLPSAHYHAALTPYMMEGWVELQRSVFRAYAIARSGERNGRRLTDEEKQRLELVVKVKGGSSDQSVDLNTVLIEIAKAMLQKLSPAEVVTIVVALALVLAGQSVLRVWLNNRKEVRLAEISGQRESDLKEERIAALNAVVAVATHDKARMGLIEKAEARLPIIKSLEDEAKESRHALVKHMSRVDAELNSVAIPSATGRILTTESRVEAEDVRLDGVYTIRRVDTTVATGFRVHLAGRNGDELVADVAEVMTTLEDRDVIREAEWKKIPVYLQINGRKRRSEVVDATIIRARPFDPDTDS